MPNRGAGLLSGVPVYSIFAGCKPYPDEYPAKQGRLTFIDSLEKVAQVVVSGGQRSEARGQGSYIKLS